MGDSRKKISCRLISRGKKDLARKCLAKKNSYTEEKKIFYGVCWKKILHPCMSGKNYHQRFGKKSPPPPPPSSFQSQMVGPLVSSFSWDVLFQETASATVTDGPEPKVTETTKVREGAEATAEVSNHIIVLLQ